MSICRLLMVYISKTSSLHLAIDTSSASYRIHLEFFVGDDDNFDVLPLFYRDVSWLWQSHERNVGCLIRTIYLAVVTISKSNDDTLGPMDSRFMVGLCPAKESDHSERFIRLGKRSSIKPAIRRSDANSSALQQINVIVKAAVYGNMNLLMWLLGFCLSNSEFVSTDKNWSYRNGYVWHDGSKDDLIRPTNGQDYVINGSELLDTHISQKYQSETMVIRRKRSWSSFDNPQQECLAHKCESNRELAAKFAPDVTERPRQEQVTDETLSPPPSNSSSEASVVMSESRDVDHTPKVRNRDLTVEGQHGTSGRMKASHVLMHLITCGTESVRNASHV
ncbi:upstream of flc-like protein [Tanacetum coccineum]